MILDMLEFLDIRAEWNFFRTSHEEKVWDGLGGTVKRLAF